MIVPADYAHWRASPIGALTERLEQKVVFELSGDLHGRRGLDLGCGDGTYSILACQRGARVIGVDLSAAMLEAAQRRAEDCGASIKWCRTSAEQLPFGSNVFDAVIAVTVLCWVKDPRCAVQEAARVLRPGGIFVIGELGRYSLWALLRRVRGWLGSPIWSETHFWTFRSLRRLTDEAALRFRVVRGSVYYPPVRPVAQALGVHDRILSCLGQFGASFLAVRADKA